jgi:flagellar capping protein FliD
MNEKHSKWDNLLLEEKQIENELDEMIQVQRDTQRIEENYHELFFQGNQLIDRLERFVGEDTYEIEELQWQSKQKQQGILYHLEDQKEQLHKEQRRIEDRQNELFYEKKRVLIEKEDIDEY